MKGVSMDATAAFQKAWEDIRLEVQNAWGAVLTPDRIGAISRLGLQKGLQPPCTLVAVVKGSGDILIARYNPNPQSGDDHHAVEKMIHATKNQPLHLPVRLFLFDDKNPHTVFGDIDADGHWQTF
jgi:hypothetical protein